MFVRLLLLAVVAEAIYNTTCLKCRIWGSGSHLLRISSGHELLVPRLDAPSQSFIANSRPDVKVQTGYTGVIEAVDLLNATAAEVPDIIMVSSSTSGWLARDQPQINKKKLLIPLNDRFKQSTPRLGYSLDKAIPDTARADCYIDGEWYCVPMMFSEYGMSYHAANLAKYNISAPPAETGTQWYYPWAEMWRGIRVLAEHGISIPWAMDPYIYPSAFTAWIQSENERVINYHTKKCDWATSGVGKMLKRDWYPAMRRSPEMAKMMAGKCNPQFYKAGQPTCTGDYTQLEAILALPVEELMNLPEGLRLLRQGHTDHPLAQRMARVLRLIRLNKGTGLVPSAGIQGYATIGSSPGTKPGIFPGIVGPRNGYYMGISRHSPNPDLAYAWIEYQWDYHNLSAPWPASQIKAKADILNQMVMTSSDPAVVAAYDTPASHFRQYKRSRGVYFISPDEAHEYTHEFELTGSLELMNLLLLRLDSSYDDYITNVTCAIIDHSLNPPRPNCAWGTEWNGDSCSLRLLRAGDDFTVTFGVRQAGFPFMSWAYGSIMLFLATIVIEHAVTQHYNYNKVLQKALAGAAGPSVVSLQPGHRYQAWLVFGQVLTVGGLWMTAFTVLADVQYHGAGNITGIIPTAVTYRALFLSLLLAGLLVVPLAPLLTYQNPAQLQHAYASRDHRRKQVIIQENSKGDFSGLLTEEGSGGGGPKVLVKARSNPGRVAWLMFHHWLTSRRRVWWLVLFVGLGPMMMATMATAVYLVTPGLEVALDAGRMVAAAVLLAVLLELITYTVVWTSVFRYLVVAVAPVILIYITRFLAEPDRATVTLNPIPSFDYDALTAACAAVMIVAFGIVVYLAVTTGQYTSDRAQMELSKLRRDYDQLQTSHNQTLAEKQYLKGSLTLLLADLPPMVPSDVARRIFQYLPLREAASESKAVELKPDLLVKNMTSNPFLFSHIRQLATVSRSEEGPVFLYWVEHFYRGARDSTTRVSVAKDIYNIFILEKGPCAINIRHEVRAKIERRLASGSRDLFDEAAAIVQGLLLDNILVPAVTLARNQSIDMVVRMGETAGCWTGFSQTKDHKPGFSVVLSSSNGEGSTGPHSPE